MGEERERSEEERVEATGGLVEVEVVLDDGGVVMIVVLELVLVLVFVVIVVVAEVCGTVGLCEGYCVSVFIVGYIVDRSTSFVPILYDGTRDMDVDFIPVPAFAMVAIGLTAEMFFVETPPDVKVTLEVREERPELKHPE